MGAHVCSHFDGSVRSFRETGGAAHVLMVACDYRYAGSMTLSGIRDGLNFDRIARHGHATDIVFMRDDLDPGHQLYPSQPNVIRQIQGLGRRCRPGDYFVFFFAGHGVSVPDQDGDEQDGMDEAFLLPNPATSRLTPMIDDIWADVVDDSLHPEVKVLAITDCCHSETITDIDSHSWGWRPICSMAACRDKEESWDTGRGGMLTRAIEQAILTLGKRHGSGEYSIEEMWDQVVGYIGAHKQGQYQAPILDYRNLHPQTEAWPLPQSWWANAPGRVPAKMAQDARMVRQRVSQRSAGMRGAEQYPAGNVPASYAVAGVVPYMARTPNPYASPIVPAYH
mmetsp:Transcript_52246/g.122274  ORF Transcript_52246/g.122274 Transcript_52246/m.122274 type:complete len:337 (-) Transcript_52246:16-1026(-)